MGMYPQMDRHWWMVAGAACSMRQIAENPAINLSPCIYLIWRDESLVYVGKTRGAIQSRIRGHLTGSKVGKALTEDIGVHQTETLFGLPTYGFATLDNIDRWKVVLLKIEGDLDAAEQFYIRLYQPCYNTAYTARSMGSKSSRGTRHV